MHSQIAPQSDPAQRQQRVSLMLVRWARVLEAFSARKHAIKHAHIAAVIETSLAQSEYLRAIAKTRAGGKDSLICDYPCTLYRVALVLPRKEAQKREEAPGPAEVKRRKNECCC